MKQITRRGFISAGTAAAAALTVARPGAVFGAETKKPLVAVAKGEPADAVKRAVAALGGIRQFVKQGDRVVIKPNMGFANPPEWGTTTHPEVVKALAQLCIEAGARRIVIFDFTLRDAEICKDKTGIGAAVKDLPGVVIATPNDARYFEEKEVPGATELTTTAVAKEVLKCDCLINVPNAKAHSATGVSFGIKNLMGVVWDRKIFHEKLELNRAVAEQLLIIKPKLTVVSAIYCLLKNGPGGPGPVEKLDTVVASADPVAVDAYAVGLARWYGKEFKGTEVKHIRIASELGLGVADVAQMDIRQC